MLSVMDSQILRGLRKLTRRVTGGLSLLELSCEDVRELPDGFTARRWPTESSWRLVKNGMELARMESFHDLKQWLDARPVWREALRRTQEAEL